MSISSIARSIGSRGIQAVKGTATTVKEHPVRSTALVGGAALGAVTLAACTKSPPKTPAVAASDTFGKFDADNNGAVDAQEAVRNLKSYDTKTFRERSYYNPDYVTVTTQSLHTTYDSSIDKLVRAAGGSDASASWQEIGDFAVSRYDSADKDGVKDGLLSSKELGKFKNEYGARTENEHTEILSESSHQEYDPSYRSGDGSTYP